MSKEFLRWVEEELRRREWRNADLARAGAMSESTVSRTLNGGAAVSYAFCNGVALAFGIRPEPLYRQAGLTPPLPTQVEDEQEIITAWRRLKPDERDVVKRAIVGLVESTPAKAPQRGDRKQEMERMEGIDEPLGDRAYDLDEIAVVMLDAVATVLTPETLKLGAQLLLLRAQARERGDPAQSLNDQLAAIGGRLQPKAERVPNSAHDPLALD